MQINKDAEGPLYFCLPELCSFEMCRCAVEYEKQKSNKNFCKRFHGKCFVSFFFSLPSVRIKHFEQQASSSNLSAVDLSMFKKLVDEVFELPWTPQPTYVIYTATYLP